MSQFDEEINSLRKQLAGTVTPMRRMELIEQLKALVDLNARAPGGLPERLATLERKLLARFDKLDSEVENLATQISDLAEMFQDQIGRKRIPGFDRSK